MATSVFHSPVPAVRHSLFGGIWRLVDPKIALASLVPFMTGVALAIEQRGAIRWGLAAAAFAAIFLVEVGKNAVNDLHDYESDMRVRPEERSPFSGGKRVLVDQLLTDQDLVIIAWVAFVAAGMVGLEVAARSHGALLILGAAAAAISVMYAAPRIRLSARGLGELAVGIVYGPGIVLGTLLLLLHADITFEAVLASTVLGLLIANVLLINEVPDEHADRETGKNTLVVRLGRDRAGTLIAVVFTCAFVAPLLGAAYGTVPLRMTALLAGVPSAMLATALLRRTPAGRPPVAAQALTLATYAIAGMAFAAAVLLTS